jgi:hypothetical protein
MKDGQSGLPKCVHFHDSSQLFATAAELSKLPGTVDCVRLIPTEECGFCEFASSITFGDGLFWVE